MKAALKYDKVWIGLAAGFLLPVIVGLVVFAFTASGRNLSQYLFYIYYADIVTHAITLCVFPNVLIFLLFLRFDMLRAARGVLAVTIVWAISVFIVKFFVR
jgi:hypothetical protein